MSRKSTKYMGVGKTAKYVVSGAMMAVVGILPTMADNVVLNTPAGFTVLSVSPNGKWACGAITDPNNPMSTQPFRWDLTSDTYVVLGDEGAAFSVADDGTVSGDFMLKEYYSNGASASFPGYWRDGEWHACEIPEGSELSMSSIDGSIGYQISADGHYMTGSVCIDGTYTAFVWKDGRIHRRLPSPAGKASVGYGVSPDGSCATGFIQTDNRHAVYWDAEGNIRYLDECAGYNSSPWNYGRFISADGSKVLVWAGLEKKPELDTTVVYCLYDVATDQLLTVPGTNIESDLEFHAISNDGTMVGSEFGRGYIYKDGVGQTVESFFESQGVDLGDIMFDLYEETDDLPITAISGISADGKVMSMLYVNKTGGTSSLVVMFDRDLSQVAPACAEGHQLNGINTVSLNWKKPAGATVRGYNVYRNGAKISGFMPINRLYYYDKNLANGTYEYKVGAVSINGKETLCEAFEVTVADMSVDVKPTNLFGRQRGVNGAMLSWEEPLSKNTHLNYANPSDNNLTSLSIFEGMEVEAGVKYPHSLIENYSGHKVSEISFRPLTQNWGWTVCLYQVDSATGELTKLYEAEIEDELVPDKIYTHHIDTPVELPQADLIASVITLVPFEGGKMPAANIKNGLAGYSDLMRSVDEEEDFFSVEESSQQQGVYTTLNWAIDLGLTAAEGGTATLRPESYNVYVDGGEAVGTEACEYQVAGLADGTHTFAVESVYADGTVSEMVETSVDIEAKYPAVNEVTVTPGVDENSKKILVEWSAPTDDDNTVISYTNAEKHYRGVHGNESTNYEFMAAALYPAAKLRGYEGYQVRSLRFYPMSQADFTLYLADGNGQILGGADAGEIVAGEWNDIKLTTNDPECDYVTIEPGTEYMVAVFVSGAEPDADVLAIDRMPGLEYYSDLVTYDGASWMSLGIDGGASGNWLIGMSIADIDGSEIETAGYDVDIDDHIVNSDRIADTNFTFEFNRINDRPHTLKVNTYYPARQESVKGGATVFYLAPSGVAENVINNITMVQGDNYIAVEGEGVESIAIYDLKGNTVASAKGNKVSINNLSAGVHMVEIKANGTSTVRKVMIRK